MTKPENVQWTTPNGYRATDRYLWAPNGDAVVEIIHGKLEIHPDLQDALASLPTRAVEMDADLLTEQARELEEMAVRLRKLAIKARGIPVSETLDKLRGQEGNWDHLND
jgi:hypothetical protein